MQRFAIAFALVASLGLAHAADEAKPATPQQEKMKACNKEATGKKGDERKQFMSSCLKGQAAAAADKPADKPAEKPLDKAADSNKAMSQQDKMKACNKEAVGKKGDERKAFMSECLKK
ncbi:PsiF family protein [Chitinimonas sp.]|uniref:PsiF family protein n=1 Tax=Chitinimonas sp. TaxID=1934313 RepID=UPI0035AF9914